MADVFRQPVDLLARFAAEFPAIVFSVKRKKKVKNLCKTWKSKQSFSDNTLKPSYNETKFESYCVLMPVISLFF